MDRGMVSRLGNNSRSVEGRSNLGNNSRGMIGRGNLGYNGGMVDRGSLGNNNRGMVGRGSMVSRGSTVSRNSSRGVDSGNRLLTVVIGVDRLRGSMGLAGYRSMSSSMGLVNRNTDRGSISMLDHLVVGLVSSCNSKESKTNKSLKY